MHRIALITLAALLTTGRGAAEGAADAVIGAALKAGDAEQEKSKVVKNCMRGRGYRVLN